MVPETHYQDRSRAQAFSSNDGDHYAKSCSAEIRARDRDLTVMLIDDIAHDRQAEAGTLAIELGGEKRLEDAVALGVGNAGPRVGDLDHERRRILDLRAHDNAPATLGDVGIR